MSALPKTVSKTKTAILVLGLLVIVAGAVLLLITEPAGTPGSGASGGIADVSDDVRPYLVEGIVLMIVGLVVAVVGLART